MKFCEHSLTHFFKAAYNPSTRFDRKESVETTTLTSRFAWRQGCVAMPVNNHSKSPLVWVVAGTGAAVLGAAILFQCFRANPGTAAEDQSGRAGVNSTKTATGTSNRSPNSGAAAAPSDSNKSATTNKDAARISHNGKSLAISVDEVANECMKRVGKEVLENLINRTIIQLACQEQGLQVTRAEVDQEIVRIAAEFKIPVEQYLQMLQAERNISPQQYRNDVIWPMLALRKLAGTDVRVSQKEIQTSFEREYGPRVKARMIICDNLRRAQTAWQKAKEDPEGFEKYVQEYSIDPASKSLDGSIPPIPRHSGSPNLETAAFKLKPGEISAVIQLDDAVQRYVILKCEGRTEPVVRELDEQVQAELEDQLKKQKIQEQVAKVFESIKSETRVDNIYAGTTTGGNKPATVARPDSSKPTGAAGQIQQAGASGTTNRVKPAIATSGDEPAAAPGSRTTPTKRVTSGTSKK